MNDLEYQSRWLSLQVHGISFVKGENLMTSLNRVADKLEIPELTKADIASMHRSQLSNAEYHERLPEITRRLQPSNLPLGKLRHSRENLVFTKPIAK